MAKTLTPQEALEAAQEALDALKTECAEDESEEAHAEHSEALKAAYAEFSAACHAVDGLKQAASNPAAPGVTEITADIAVQMDANA